MGWYYGLEQNWWNDGRRDITACMEAALTYLSRLHARFDQDWFLALAAYNTGGGNLNRSIRRNARAGQPTDFWSLRLPRDRKSTRLNSSHVAISYAVFCLQKNTTLMKSE